MPLVAPDDTFALLEPAYRGEPIHFAPGASITAKLLREHILEIVPSTAERSMTPLRWILHGATISGLLDLSDARSKGGTPLPAIAFHNCIFDAGFCASGASIERLEFEECHFTASDPKDNVIALRNIRIATELRLVGVAPNVTNDEENNPGLLWVDAFAAQIGTNVVLKRATLRAPRGEFGTAVHDARYALDLATAEIGSDLHLQPKVSLHGGLKLRDAHIGGTIWGQALHVTDGETEASRKQIFEQRGEPRKGIFGQSVVVRGGVSLSLNEQLITEGPVPTDLADIQEDLSPDPIRFWSIGVVSFLAAHIDGLLDLRGGYVEGWITLDHAFIGGSVFAFKETVPLVLQRLGRQTTFRLITKGLLMNRCHVAGDLRLSLTTETLTLQGAEIGGKLSISGQIRSMSAAGISVDGDTEFGGTTLNQCNLGGARLKGQLDLSGATFAAGTLDIRDADIGHSLTLAPLFSKIDSIKRKDLCCYPGYALFQVKLGSYSDENALPEQDHKRVERMVAFIVRSGSSLGFLGLPRKVGPSISMPYLGNLAILSDPTRALLLNGSSHPFHFLNEKGKLSLQTAKQKEEYLRLFCAYVWTDESSFALVETDDQLPQKFRGRVPVHPIRLVTNENTTEKESYTFDTYIKYGKSLRQVRFVLDGTLPSLPNDSFVLSDGELVTYSEVEVSTVEPPFRIQSEVRSEVFLEDEASEKELLSVVPDWRESIVRDRFNRAQIDLRDTSCGTLHDNAGRIWEGCERYQLDGFRYSGMFSPQIGSIEGEITVRRFWVRGKARIGNQWALEAIVRLLILMGLGQMVTSLRGRWKTVPAPESPFRAQPYAHLAKVLRERGNDEAARDIEADKIYWGAYDRALGSVRGWLTFIFWWTPYGLLFRFGLAPLRAILTLVLFWFLGFASISMLNESNMLEANVTKVAPAARETSAVIPAAQGISVGSLPCGRAIAPALYAAELLTPILNLHQESSCDIVSAAPTGRDKIPLTLWRHPIRHWKWMEDPGWWKYFKALYIILGTIISSLSLLTFSGIARRWEN